MNRVFLCFTLIVSLLGTCCGVTAATVAREDFDGGDVNLISSSVPALDGGAGDYFGVGSRNGWPQGLADPGVPFSIGDDSAISYSNGVDSVFPDDTEGVFGENSDFDNRFFALSDSDEFGDDQAASWRFDISGFQDLSLSIDMGGISNESFGGFNATETDIVFTAQIDGGGVQTAFDLNVFDVTDGIPFTTRLMDAGTQSGGGNLLQVTGDNPITKVSADSGTIAGNTFLDKTPPSGAGAGQLDTFVTSLDGTGSELVLTMTANLPFEAAVFDNISIEGQLIPEPQSLHLMMIALMAMFLLRRGR